MTSIHSKGGGDRHRHFVFGHFFSRGKVKDAVKVGVVSGAILRVLFGGFEEQRAESQKSGGDVVHVSRVTYLNVIHFARFGGIAQ